jgi:hypothetical protein
MKTQFEQMMDGLNDVEVFLAGKQEGFRAHVPQEVENPAAVLTALNPAAYAAVVGSKRTPARVRVDRKRQTASGVKRKTHSAEGGKRIAK